MRTSTAQAIAELDATGQDFEWYPTTNEIISAFHKHASRWRLESLLDIGAGNGKVLNRFKELNKRDPEDRDNYHTEYFAIEKARPLLDSLPIDVGILGTDFWEQSLLDKSVDCVFSNPPYSEFIDWSAKVIREANANYIYLVIPQRWKNQQPILNAIEARKATYEVIGEFDFLSSEDRTARAKVDLVFISLCGEAYRDRYHRSGIINNKVDPFALWVEEFFHLSEKVSMQDVSEYDRNRSAEKDRKATINNSLVPGKSTIEVLDVLYRKELDGLISNYQKVSELDQVLFKELDISIKSIIGSIRSKVKGLKNAYWHELFDNYTPLTSRLTASSRRAFIESITRKTSIDFTASNAYAITVWAIKNANGYLDSQMIETFNKMVDSACVINYKSNERVFKKNHYRYHYDDDKHTHFKLDYRIVVTRMGGMSQQHYSSIGGLSESAANFLDDLIVIAKNLGFDSSDAVRNHNFTAGGKEEFYCTNKAGKHIKLMEVRAYMNGNLHIKFNQAFMLALNVEIGRLQGWIHNAQHAAEEMGEKVEHVYEFFNTAYSLENDGNVVQLLTAKAA
ncbi:MAG: DUF4942 domain-containing protein [Nitrosomonas sp.]|nr:DUF4942 domain-containing protein [Nitrosomonas sp.]